MDYARQNMNNNNNNNIGTLNNSQNNDRSVTKPVIPAKPTNLNSKTTKDNSDGKAQLTRMSSLTHMTPKIWTKSDRIDRSNLNRPTEVKTKHDLTPKSPFEKKWRPAPQLNLNKNKSNNVCVPATKPKPDKTIDNTTKNGMDNIKVLLETSDIKQPDDSNSSNKILEVRKSGKTLNRQSMRRNPKSPGFDTIKKMFNLKPEDASTIITKPKLKLSNSNQWQHVSSPINRNSSIPAISVEGEKEETHENNENIFKYDNSFVQLQQNDPVEDIGVSYTKEANQDQFEENENLQPQSEQAIIVDNTDFVGQNTDTDTVDSNDYNLIDEMNENIQALNQDHYSSTEDFVKSFKETMHFDPPTGIYESLDDSSSSDSAQQRPRVPTYYEFEDSSDDITSAVYEIEEKMESLGDVVIKPPASSSEQPQEYLPMTGSNLKSAPSIKYVEMKPKSDIDKKYPIINYSDQVVPAPTHVKFKREYHTIDPNSVPAPPDRDPPKLPTSKNSRDDNSSHPPPLPPDNTFGRRSQMYSKNKQKKIVNDLKEKLAKNNLPGQAEKKLNYIEVEVSDNNSTQLPVLQKTNYSDVVVLSDSEFQRTRNRSGSGTSEEGKKKPTKKKGPFQIFSTKENQGLDSSSKAKEDNEVLTDFGKERNKKKRISERFIRRKGKTDKKNKKERNSDDSLSKSFESDSGTYDVETITPALSGNTSGVSGGSLQSSGDGEVPTNGISRINTDPTTQVSRQKSVENIEVNPPLPKPRSTIKTPNKLRDTADTPKVQSFLHGSPKTTIKHEKSLSQLSSDSDLPPRDHIPSSTDSFPSYNPPLPPRDYSSLSSGLCSNNSPDKISGYDATGLVTPGIQQLMSRPRCPSPLVLAKRDTVTIPPPLVRVDGSSDHVSYDMADDIPPPLPDRDDEVHPSNVVPPSPYTENGELGSSKFLNSEPLYQIYRDRTLSCASMARRTKGKSKRGQPVTEWKSEFMSEDLGTSTLWRSIPEVAGSSFIEGMTQQEIKLQQAQFEVLTSQASYLRSLNILVEHFMKDWAMQSHDYLPLKERHHLYSNIETVQSIEKKFLQELEKHFWSDLYLTKISELVAKYANYDFNVYALYIQNQVYQDRVLTQLQRTNDNFAAELCRLESSPVCNKLPLLSFLMLPMQRVTRLPLLVSAIIKAADAANNKEICLKAKHALGVVNKLVKKCNESARKMQQTEQLAEIASQIDYSLSIKTFALVSQSRSLVKKGEMSVSMATDNKKATKNSKLWLFLFTDVLFIARKKSYLEVGNSNPRFEVIDWCKRSTICVNEKAIQESVIFLVLLENQAGKRVEITLNPVAQNELSRWTKALSPPTPAGEGESIYETWDCPQFVCVDPYEAQQPDELSIDVDDVMQVLKKTSDGWLEGERLRDGETGWFPISNCKEIDDEHVRIRNMKNLYRTAFG